MQVKAKEYFIAVGWQAPFIAMVARIKGDTFECVLTFGGTATYFPFVAVIENNIIAVDKHTFSLTVMSILF